MIQTINNLKESGELKPTAAYGFPPIENSLFEMQFDFDKKNWFPWKSSVEYRIPKETEFHEIFIPTTDSIRHRFILSMLTIHSFPTLFLGKTGILLEFNLFFVLYSF